MILRPLLEQEKEVIELKGRIGGIPANKYGWSFSEAISLIGTSDGRR